MSQSSPIPPTDVRCDFCGAAVGEPCKPKRLFDAATREWFVMPVPAHLVAHHSRIRASEAQGRLPLGQPATEAVSRSEGSTETKEE